MTTIIDLLTFVATEATDDDLERFYEAAKNRRRALRDQQTALIAAQLQKGSEVTLDDLSPKALNGLTGVVESISGSRAAVRLDKDSTQRLSWSNTRYAAGARIAGEGLLLPGIPIGCCKPKVDA